MNYPKPTKEDRLKERILRLKAKVKVKKEPSLAQLKKKVRIVFHKWIRERDRDLPCISCGKVCGEWDAGHFWSQGASGILRFHPDNVHKQGTGCNRYKHGNLLEYRINLIKKIGQKRYDWLENNRKKTKRWTREELNSLLEKYKSFAFDNSR